MKKRMFLSILLMTLLTSCEWFNLFRSDSDNSQVNIETWQESPSGATTKIKVITNFKEEEIKDYYVQRVLKMKFKINMGSIIKNNFSTEPMRYENYFVKLNFVFDINKVTISGYYGDRGLNSYWSNTGSTIIDSEISWNAITYGSSGWELMHTASQLSEYSHPKVITNTEYNNIN